MKVSKISSKEEEEMSSRENLDERRRELIRQWNERNSTSEKMYVCVRDH